MAALTIRDSKRLVIKIGSALLVDDEGDLRSQWINALVSDAVEMYNSGTEIIIVSSGAIAIGRRILGLSGGPRNRALKLEESQASAAIGQVRLAHAWQEALEKHHIRAA